MNPVVVVKESQAIASGTCYLYNGSSTGSVYNSTVVPPARYKDIERHHDLLAQKGWELVQILMHPINFSNYSRSQFSGLMMPDGSIEVRIGAIASGTYFVGTYFGQPLGYVGTLLPLPTPPMPSRNVYLVDLMPKCECGAAKVKSNIHSSWCPKA